MIEIIFRCDNCGICFESNVKSCDYYPTKKWLINTARYLGFTVGKKILCPDCNGKENKNKALYEKLKKKGAAEFDKILQTF